MKTDASPLQPLQTITLALAASPTIFLGAVLFLSLSKRPESGRLPGDTPVMAGIAALLWAGAVLASGVVNRLREKGLAGPSPFEAYQQYHIVRLALFEGAALAGLVFLLMAASKIPLADHPVLLLYLIPYLTLLAVAALHFPTRDKFDFLVKQAKESVG